MEKNNNFDDDRTFEYTGKAKPKKKAIEVKNGLIPKK
jgi:5-methylcytosine-specific restriction protein A